MQLRSLLLTCAALIASATITSCGNDPMTNSEEEIIAQAYSENVPYAVSKAFSSQYPTAAGIEWNEDGEYYQATFTLNSKRIEAGAWYDSLGAWAMSQLDYGTSTAALPATVLDEFHKSVYGFWDIENVTEFQYPDPSQDYYVLEASTNGRDVNVLYFKVTNGKARLLKTSTDTNYPVGPKVQL